jgi:hypothetical protein
MFLGVILLKANLSLDEVTWIDEAELVHSVRVWKDHDDCRNDPCRSRMA